MDTVDVGRQLAEQQTLTTFVAGVLGFVALYLALAPVAECPSCPHCRNQRVRTDPTCPLHKAPRSTCQSQHEDD